MSEDKEDKIMNEITEFCMDCEYCQCCPEEDCILFRIEQFILSNEN